VLETGAKLPQLSVLDDSGNTVTTGDLLGKTLVLWFYPKDDTPG
jgi:peroxiredoxin Q/BCP